MSEETEVEVMPMSAVESMTRRFEAKYIPEPMSGCWIWTASINEFRNIGYGVFGIGRKTYAAHRIAWRLFRGDIPKGSNVLHKCDVGPCVNPDHLFLGTQRDNVIDMINKGRQRVSIAKAIEASHAAQTARQVCKHGHPFDGANLFIQQNGSRGCRECRLNRSRKHRQLRKNGV